MENSEEEDDLKLVKASASLLADLENALPKLLSKPAKSGSGRRLHTRVKRRDLDYVTRLIEPFQGEPQLLDARLKHILPPIVDAYLAYIQLPHSGPPTDHLDLQTATCSLLYTLCKVRGYKVILGFLSNEPRYLEPILLRVEALLNAEVKPEWQVPYVLLLWLSHLLLTPFDLASISDGKKADASLDCEDWLQDLPSVAARSLAVGLKYLPTSTKAQDAAAMFLVRLIRRPDMQKLRLGDQIVSRMLQSLDQEAEATVSVYERLGPIRLLSGVAASPELGHLVPNIYRACQKLSEGPESFITTNAVAKKLVVKIFRDIAILSIRSPDAQGSLLSFFEATSVLEDVIDYLLRSLGDRDTPVRFAAAKAISLIVLELDQDMREEVVQAVLDIFKEDMPRSSRQMLDFRTANALKWHGLTLCLSHTLFKRSASPSQLPDIVESLISALQFEQRTATGSSVGTNVRDAANFGIWSLSRRYTTNELLSVDVSVLSSGASSGSDSRTIIQLLANELVLSACLDPAGNIRRGSSAALQELIGRHPHQVEEGIALVQTVDYQAVGLRRRAMVDVALRATELHNVYFRPVRHALLGWPGLGSVDVVSRAAAATSLARLGAQGEEKAVEVLHEVLKHARTVPPSEKEPLHGIVSTMATIFEQASMLTYGLSLFDPTSDVKKIEFDALLKTIDSGKDDFSPRVLRSELPSGIARMLAAYCSFLAKRARYDDSETSQDTQDVNFDLIESMTDRLLTRGEETIREAIPPLARSLLALKHRSGRALGCLGSQTLIKQVTIDGAKSTLNGAGRAMALGALAPMYGTGLHGSRAAEIVSTLGSLTGTMSIDWRIIGIRALQLSIEGSAGGEEIEGSILDDMVKAVHCGLSDYTIDERGDVGSLVRLQAIACTSSIFARCNAGKYHPDEEPLRILQSDIFRLSLEKLDRVRLAAAQCQSQHFAQNASGLDLAAVSSHKYFAEQFGPLLSLSEPDWKYQALLEGAISAAGISAEQLLQGSRSALAETLAQVNEEHLARLMTLYTTILKSSLSSSTSPITTPALALLAFLLDMRIPQRLASASSPPFKWLNLLSAVQKAHHKSNDIPKIAAAVAVYRGLAEVEVIRAEVLKKVLSMLRTNPYPRVRVLVAETLWVVLDGGDGGQSDAREVLKGRDWMADRKVNEGVVTELEEKLLG